MLDAYGATVTSSDLMNPNYYENRYGATQKNQTLDTARLATTSPSAVGASSSGTGSAITGGLGAALQMVLMGKLLGGGGTKAGQTVADTTIPGQHWGPIQAWENHFATPSEPNQYLTGVPDNAGDAGGQSLDSLYNSAYGDSLGAPADVASALGQGGDVAATGDASNVLAGWGLGDSGLAGADAGVNVAGGTSSLLSSGALSGGLLSAAIAAQMENAKEQGGAQILSGDAKSKDWINQGMAWNPLTTWINPLLRLFGAGSVGTDVSHMLFGGDADTQARGGFDTWAKKQGLFTTGADDTTFVNSDGKKIDIGSGAVNPSDPNSMMYNIDPSQQSTADALNPIGQILGHASMGTGGTADNGQTTGDALSSQITAALTNAVAQGGDLNQNILAAYKQGGLKDMATTQNAINQLLAAGKIDDWTAKSMGAGANQVFNPNATNAYANSPGGVNPADAAAYQAHFGYAPGQQPQGE